MGGHLVAFCVREDDAKLLLCDPVDIPPLMESGFVANFNYIQLFLCAERGISIRPPVSRFFPPASIPYTTAGHQDGKGFRLFARCVCPFGGGVFSFVCYWWEKGLLRGKARATSDEAHVEYLLQASFKCFIQGCVSLS